MGFQGYIEAYPRRSELVAAICFVTGVVDDGNRETKAGLFALPEGIPIMIWKRSGIFAAPILLMILSAPWMGNAQQAPKKLSIIRNDSAGPVTFEYKNGGEWTMVKVDAQKDVSITGERVRIGTDRQDKATITVDLPIEGGKKYLVFWNDPPGMWDFKGTS